VSLDPLRHSRLQRGRVISDQTFQSYAMIAEGPVEELWTSHRQRPREESPVSPLTMAFATLGTVVSIAGFILQFIGLRGSHWTVSIAQLAATMLMTAVRAFIRRGMSKRPSAVLLEKDFELEWLASAISKDRENFGYYYSNLRAVRQKAQHWIRQEWAKPLRLDRFMPKHLRELNIDNKVYSSRTLRVNICCRPSESRESDPSVPLVRQGAMEVIQIRQNLGQQIQWVNPASDAAVSLANSIEVVLNTLLQPSAESFKWGIDVYFGDEPQRVQMTVNKNEKRAFHVSLTEIEALLSMWLQHVRLRELRDQTKESKSKQEESNSKQGVDWLRRKTRKQNLRVLGQDSSSLRRDLKWWLPSGGTTVLRIEKGRATHSRTTGSEPKEPQHYLIDYHRIIGFSETEDAVPKDECVAVDFKCSAASFDELATTGVANGVAADKSKPGVIDNRDTGNDGKRDKIEEIRAKEPEIRNSGHIIQEAGGVPTSGSEVTASQSSVSDFSLAVISGTQRELLFAQHIFTAFMWAVAKEIPRIRGVTKASQSMTIHPTAWQHYQLENSVSGLPFLSNHF
jgi:hypothetical protein